MPEVKRYTREYIEGFAATMADVGMPQNAAIIRQLLTDLDTKEKESAELKDILRPFRKDTIEVRMSLNDHHVMEVIPMAHTDRVVVSEMTIMMFNKLARS